VTALNIRCIASHSQLMAGPTPCLGLHQSARCESNGEAGNQKLPNSGSLAVELAASGRVPWPGCRPTSTPLSCNAAKGFSSGRRALPTAVN